MTSATDHTTYIAGFPFFPRRPPINPPPAWTTRPPTPQPTQHTQGESNG